MIKIELKNGKILEYEKPVKIKNLINSRVVVEDPSTRISRSWERKGAIRTIEMDDLEQLIYVPGVEYMFREGVLDIAEPNREEILVKLGLQEEDGSNKIIILSEGEMKKLLGDTTTVAYFRQKIAELPREQINELVNYCVDNKILNYEKVNILKEKTGKDIFSMVRLREANDEKTSEEE